MSYDGYVTGGGNMFLKAIFQNKESALGAILVFLLLFSNHANAFEKIILSAPEREPYIAENLEQNGYVSEVMKAAFENSGYDVAIEFYPLIRGKSKAQQGKVNGFTPAYIDRTDVNFVYSESFPGDQIGLLKRSDLDVSYADNPVDNFLTAMEPLKKYNYGLINGYSFHPDFDQSDEFEKEFVSDQLINIDKLAKKRIDFVVIDKYTAADLITRHRPHLIGQFEFMSPVVSEKPFHVAFSKQSPTYERDLMAFNKGLQQIKNDGELVEIQKRHGLFSTLNKDDSKTRIVIGTVNNNDMAVMQKLSDGYQKLNPDIAIEWRVTGEETLRKRLLGDLSINDGQYDVMTLGAYEVPIWAKRGWLNGVSSHLNDAYNVDDLIRPVREALSNDGKLYALPFYAESSMTYYNKSLFNKSEISMPHNPTYDQVRDFASKIHDPDNNIYGVCLRGKAGWGSNMALITTMVNTYGGRWFDENWVPQLQSDPWQNALRMYVDLLKNYGPPNSEKTNFNENKNLFANGQCGMWIDATVAAGMLFDSGQTKIHDKVGFAFAPTAVTPKGAHWLWVWSLAVPKSSKNTSEAMDFIQWATSQDYIKNVADNFGWVSVPPGTRISTYQNDNYKNAAPFSKFVEEAIQKVNISEPTKDPVPYTGIQFVAIPEFSAFGDLVGAEIQKVLEGKETIDTALEKANNIVRRQMKSSGYIK